MIKRLIGFRNTNYLNAQITHSLAFLRPHPNEKTPAKAYQVLLRNNIENTIKFPSAEILKHLRSRGITKIMAANHNIDETDQVLEAHVECLYALIHRIEPSIEAISMFAETVSHSARRSTSTSKTCALETSPSPPCSTSSSPPFSPR
jgi:hypothetical protein